MEAEDELLSMRKVLDHVLKEPERQRSFAMTMKVRLRNDIDKRARRHIESMAQNCQVTKTKADVRADL
jgi:hypothetical protein